MSGIKQYLKNEGLKEVFSDIKSIRRHAKDKANNHNILLPAQLRMLFYGSGRKQFLSEKEVYFIKGSY